MSEILKIAERLKTQDNRITDDPMFCVQIKVRDVGYDSNFTDNICWYNSDSGDVIYNDDKDFIEPETSDWDEFGYKDRWQTVMVAFTEIGCEDYLKLDGHNVRSMAFRGEVRIYVESFRRCNEMVSIREALMNHGELKA